MPYRVLLYYQFAEVPAPKALAESQLLQCQELGLRGRIIIATEGINGTVSGPAEACESHMEALRAVFPEIEFKIDMVEGHVFKGLSVKVRDEIITMGVPLGTPVYQKTGRHLSPEEWREAIQQDDVVLLDGRNDYESELGHFEGALLPPLESFRDFPAWILAHREQLEGKRILTYCTGGIRCEKATAYMLEQGFAEVFHLQDGILKYLEQVPPEESLWEGNCFVFDERVTVDHQLQPAPLELCPMCKTAVEPHHRTSPLYELGVRCPTCADTLTFEQIERAREKQRQLELAQARDLL